MIFSGTAIPISMIRVGVINNTSIVEMMDVSVEDDIR